MGKWPSNREPWFQKCPWWLGGVGGLGRPKSLVSLFPSSGGEGGRRVSTPHPTTKTGKDCVKTKRKQDWRPGASKSDSHSSGKNPGVDEKARTFKQCIVVRPLFPILGSSARLGVRRIFTEKPGMPTLAEDLLQGEIFKPTEYTKKNQIVRVFAPPRGTAREP